jgi:undecaprenyl-diphosphatase
MGLLFKDQFEKLYASVSFVGIMLMATGLIVLLTRFIPTHKNRTPGVLGIRNLVWLWAALAVGTAQGFAIIPGISRSGITIAVGLLCGLERGFAGRFSFLLSVPAILGAVALNLTAENIEHVGIVPLLCGFIISAFVGYFALKLLMNMLQKGKLHYFAPYCFGVGLLVILFL